MLAYDDGRSLPRMGDGRDRGALGDDRRAALGGGDGELSPRPLHDRGAGSNGAPLAGRAAARPGPSIPRDRAPNGSVDDDGNARGAVASAWGGRLPAGSRPASTPFTQPLKIAIPAKGRLREPAVGLLEDAGLGPEQPGERALAFPCRNAPVEVLLVRAADIPEYVQDGVVDCGITGADLVIERSARVSELLRLGFGACTLEAAVLVESDAQTITDLHGRRVATVYPRLTRTLLAERGV